jgi:hypothetical protein
MRGKPAETGGGLGALAVAVAYAAGCSVDTVAAVGIAAGLVPVAVTWVVDHGGIRGALRSLWQGRR